jgi:hypothetical protein
MRLRSALLLVLTLLTTAPGAAAQDVSPTLSGGEQRALILKIAEYLRDEYVFSDIGAATADELTRRATLDDKPMTAEAFAREWSAALRQLTKDGHVRVRYAPATTGTRTPQELNPALDNYGIRRVEWLPKRIGYLRIDRFFEADESRKALDAALTLLAPAAAIVIDLRENGGGSDANNLLASYFFADRILFNELRWKKEEA